MYIVKRLQKGQDLKREIENIVKENNIKAGIILSSVGCLNHLHIRLAGGKEYLESSADYEIVSLNGTLSLDGLHLHIAVSDINGKCIGGHLCYNCIVNTTCELVVESIDEYLFSREFDDNTGYRELVVKEKENETY